MRGLTIVIAGSVTVLNFVLALRLAARNDMVGALICAILCLVCLIVTLLALFMVKK